MQSQSLEFLLHSQLKNKQIYSSFFAKDRSYMCSTFVFSRRRITDLCLQSKTKIDLSLADNEEQSFEDEEKL
jgi:hypothetical protein